MTDTKEVVAGLDAGADEYLTKPVDHRALVARVRSMLRIKALHDRAEALATEVSQWNASLERRVAEQVAELERVGKLRRFFSPQLAEAILSGGAEDPLKSHRREITVMFCDLRGFTAFAEISEPEEVMGVLREYHAATGELILEYEGTLERFTGDGMMIFFNDPVPMPDACERAVRMALAMRDRIAAMAAAWAARGYELSHGIGIAQGYATLGAIGFEGRWDYGAIGTVTNLAARLCAEAAADEVLVSQRVAGPGREFRAARAREGADAQGISSAGARPRGDRAQGCAFEPGLTTSMLQRRQAPPSHRLRRAPSRPRARSRRSSARCSPRRGAENAVQAVSRGEGG